LPFLFIHRDQDIVNEFSKYGQIGDFYRPNILSKRKQSSYCFIRYYNASDGQYAIDIMNGAFIWDTELSVQEANEQNTFFTEATGYLTNYVLKIPPREPPEFDPSLPRNHYEVKKKEQLKHADQFYTVRIDDLHPSIR
jgi:RNA recognition motif-containing protein